MKKTSNRKIQTPPEGLLHRGRAVKTFSFFTLATLALLGSPFAIGATFIVEEATEEALRAAVLLANQTAGPDRIEFAQGVTSITLTQGQIEITESLTIAGTPSQVVTLSGNNASRVFAVIDPGQTFPFLRLEHLVVENGSTTEPGSALLEAPLINCSTSTGQGGAICTEASVELVETIVRNSVTEGQMAHGGGIWAAFDVFLQFSSVFGNTVGGQAIDGDDTNGGGIASAFGEVVCSDSRIANNQSIDLESQGGGVFATGFFANNCIVSGNEAGSGGGIFSSYIYIFASTVEGNTAGFSGGGILASYLFIPGFDESFGALQIVNSTISGNQAVDGRGGGIRWIAPDNTVDIDGDESPDARISNSTITGNSAAFGAGGVDIVDPFFISLFSLSRLGTIENRNDSASRFGMIENRAQERRGAVPPRLDADGVFAPEITSTILSANVGNPEANPDLVIIEGQRLVELLDQNNFIGFGDLLDIEELRDNGCWKRSGALADGLIGCVQTHRPLSSSSVIDNGLNPLQLSFEQRGEGFAREIGSAADIGAHETEPLAIEVLDLEVDQVRRGDPIGIEWRAVPDVPAVVCEGGGLVGTTWDGAGKPAIGLEDVDSTPLDPGPYVISLACTLDGETLAAFTGLQVLDPLEAFITLEQASVPLGEVVNLSWSAFPDDSATVCIAESMPLVSAWAGSVANSGSLDIDTALLVPGNYALTLACQRDEFNASDTVDLSITDDGLNLSLALTPEVVIIGDSVQIEWTVLPDDEFTACVGSGLEGTNWSGAQANSGSFTLDSAELATGSYTVALACTRFDQEQSASAALTIDPLELSLELTPSSLIRGDSLSISWTGTAGLVCTGSGLPGTTWPGAGKPASGNEIIATAPLAAGDYTVGLLCERAGLTVQAEALVTVLPLELTLVLTPSSLIRGDNLSISWTGPAGLVCTGSGLPGTTWPGAGKPASGTETVATAPLAAGDYTVGLLCERAGLTVQAEALVTVLPLELTLVLTPSSLIRGDNLSIAWTGPAGLSCTGSGLPGTTWPGAGKPASGNEIVATAPLAAGDYTVGLLCEREGLTVQAEALVTVLPLELTLELLPTSLIRGDNLSIAWTGTAGLSCTGSGLPGTTWPGAGKPASGNEIVATAPLAAGDYQVDLACERLGVSIQAQSNVAVLPLELTLDLTPTSLIRGDSLTINWTGTAGLVCTGSGLPGTSWPGEGKPASGSETIGTEILDRGEYPVSLACQRRGVEVAATAVVTVLAKPAELSLSASLINMAIEGSEFVKFALSNPSENPGFELQLSFDPPEGYEVAAVFRQASECSVAPGDPSEVRCEVGAIPDWTCETGPAGGVCRLLTLPPGGIAGVVIQYQGAGEATVVGSASAVNAEDRSAELSIGN